MKLARIENADLLNGMHNSHMFPFDLIACCPGEIFRQRLSRSVCARSVVYTLKKPT